MFLAHLHVFAATTLACLAMVLPATATASATASAAAAAAEPVYRHLSNTFALLLLLLVLWASDLLARTSCLHTTQTCWHGSVPQFQCQEPADTVGIVVW